MINWLRKLLYKKDMNNITNALLGQESEAYSNFKKSKEIIDSETISKIKGTIRSIEKSIEESVNIGKLKTSIKIYDSLDANNCKTIKKHFTEKGYKVTITQLQTGAHVFTIDWGGYKR